jgi:DNA primase
LSKLSSSARKALESACQQFSESIQEDPTALGYLTDRGISLEAINVHRLGVVRSAPPGFEMYLGRLAIPYCTPTGVVDIRFRALDDDITPKYLTRPGVTGHLFNVNAFQVDSPFIAITEGELDAVVASSLCDMPSVGVAGANAWKPFYSRAFQDYEQVFLLCDGDAPGRDWGNQIARQVDNAVTIHMPEGHDVNSMFVLEGPNALRKRCGLRV